MQPPFPSPINTWHNDTYPAIDPARPELSVKGKKIVVTGGGAGIGRETVQSFAVAGASSIVITGRRAQPLAETKQFIESKYGVPVSTFSADVTDVVAMKKVAAEVGAWDILVNNAGYLSKFQPAVEADLNDWWLGYEINVKGTMVVAQAFIPYAKKDAVFIGTATAAITLPTHFVVGSTSYIGSKMGLVKVLEILAKEVEDKVSVRILHPGVIFETEMGKKGELEGKLPADTPALAANYTVWLASKEAAPFSGRLMSVNFDVDEIKAVADKVPGSVLWQTELHGWNGPGFIF